jgi:hypothetical protein
LTAPRSLFLPVIKGPGRSPGQPSYQIISYEAGDAFSAHYDADKIGGEGPTPATCLAMVERDDDLDGGATLFPELDLRVEMGVGDLLCWRNVDADSAASNRAMREALHAGEAVRGGRKTVMTTWVEEEDIRREEWGDVDLEALWGGGFERDSII